jgi:hypothetical protein
MEEVPSSVTPTPLLQRRKWKLKARFKSGALQISLDR